MKKIDTKTVAEESAQLADQAADKIKDAVDATRGAADKTLRAAEEGIGNVREGVSDKVGHAAAEFGKYVRAGRDCAWDACDAVKGRLSRAGECSVSYVREKPVQAILIAAVGGALLAGLINLLTRSHTRDRDF